MKRREFARRLAGFGASTAGLVLMTGCGFMQSASRPPSVAHVGWLKLDANDTDAEQRDQAFRQGLRDHGWVEGQNLAIELRGAEGLPERLPELAAELARLPLDVILSERTPPTLATKQASSTIPIVMVGVGSPVENGLVDSLARPGANLTGVSLVTLEPKHLELLNELVPGLTRIAFLMNAGNPASRRGLDSARAAAQALNLQLQVLDVRLDVRAEADLQAAFAATLQWPAEAIYSQLDPVLKSPSAQVAAFATQYHLPTMFERRYGPEAGGLISYGVALPPLYHRAAEFVDKILRGANPADLPVEQLTTVEFAINVKAAQALGLTMPPDVAAQVTEWVP
jgi:putative ABC transport system substrate-binding protein